MSAKHTAGPWSVLPEEVDRPYIRVRGTQPGGRYKIANVPTPVYDGVLDREADETRANARLIAAAPYLLNVVCEMEAFSEAAMNDCIDAGDEQGRIVWLARLEHCRGAITKAQGETA